MNDQPQSTPVPAPSQVAGRREVLIRRAPKFVPFLVAGAVVGVLVAAVVALSGSGSEQFAPSAVFGFFAVLFAVAGAGLGAVVALVLDRRSVRQARRAAAEPLPEAPDAGAPGQG